MTGCSKAAVQQRIHKLRHSTDTENGKTAPTTPRKRKAVSENGVVKTTPRKRAAKNQAVLKSSEDDIKEENASEEEPKIIRVKKQSFKVKDEDEEHEANHDF